jgi:hypothetical protein
MDPDKIFQRTVAGISKNVKNKTWLCLIEGCTNIAVNSHLLQKNGILNNIADGGHIVELKQKDIYKWTHSDSHLLNMEPVGINNAFSLPIFCSNHDSSIFKLIETPPMDFTKYICHLLLSYRVVCAEIRKKETTIELNSRMLKAHTLSGLLDDYPADIIIKGTKVGIDELNRYKIYFENEINESQGQFVYKVFEYPIIKIYCSACFSPMKALVKDIDHIEFLNYVFIHIIPHREKLIIIVGYHRNHVSEWVSEFVNQWYNLQSTQLQLCLTNLFATRIENWGMSPSVFQQIPIRTKNMLTKYFQANAQNYLENQHVDFNLFENIS